MTNAIDPVGAKTPILSTGASTDNSTQTNQTANTKNKPEKKGGQNAK